ncbi:site-specific integrase [Rhizosphaericola mali]|uniref:Tyrosine-type recombinase/integrase n=1 Tax=Rhizosphaericola mali TaxID=2545455 RepID=A0A5P2FZC6_9BACT|nr:site-specific integrase [Rhizosphaericola mali]QES88886.1 tyrosine-type recombinase/integrase [Rhizosphaericola mali]
MKKIVASCEVFLDKRRIKKDNTFPVKLKVTFNRERKYYNTNVNISEYEWNCIHQKRTPNTLLRIKQKFKELEVSAQNCIDKIDRFTFFNFEKAYFPKRPDKHNVEYAYREFIQELNAQERFGSANLYECSISALLKYKSNLRFDDVTPLFLEKFEKYIINKGLSITTVGIYIRPLRAIINREIRNENYSLNDYPFTKGKYTIPTGRNIKKALSIETIKQIISFDTESDKLMEFYKDIWLFSFYCNGMNVADICHLKYKNMQGNIFVFQRLKTLRTYKSNPKYIKVAISAPVRQIINKWSIPMENENSYIFPLLNDSLSPFQTKEKTRIVSHSINAQMRKIAQKIGFSGDITTYSARHSYATILLNLGAPIKLVSDNLGHSTVSVTDNYLAGFTDDFIIDYANKMDNLFK